MLAIQARVLSPRASFVKVASRPPNDHVGDEDFTTRWHHPADCGTDHVQVARGDSGEKSQVADAPQQGVTKHFSFGCSISRRRPPIRAAYATSGNRFHIGVHIHFALIAWRAR